MTDTRALEGRIHTALDSIASAWDDTLEPARRATGSQVTSNLVNPPLPVPADVLDKRAKAHERLACWSRAVVEGQHLHLLPAIDVAALTDFLAIHCEWLAASPAGPKATGELENSAAELGVIASDNAPRHQDVGPCPGTTNGLPCPGKVKATVRADDDLLPSELVCSGTPSHAWPAAEWRLLERRMHANAGAERRLTAQRGQPMDAGASARLAAAIRS